MQNESREDEIALVERLRFVKIEAEEELWWPCLLYKDYKELITTVPKSNMILKYKLSSERYKKHVNYVDKSVARILGKQRPNGLRLRFVAENEEKNLIKDFFDEEATFEDQYDNVPGWKAAYAKTREIIDLLDLASDSEAEEDMEIDLVRSSTRQRETTEQAESPEVLIAAYTSPSTQKKASEQAETSEIQIETYKSPTEQKEIVDSVIDDKSPQAVTDRVQDPQNASPAKIDNMEVDETPIGGAETPDSDQQFEINAEDPPSPQSPLPADGESMVVDNGPLTTDVTAPPISSVNTPPSKTAENDIPEGKEVTPMKATEEISKTKTTSSARDSKITEYLEKEASKPSSKRRKTKGRAITRKEAQKRKKQKTTKKGFVEEPRKNINTDDLFATAVDILVHSMGWRDRIRSSLSTSGFMFVHGKHKDIQSIDEQYCISSNQLEEKVDYFFEADHVKEYLHKTYGWVGPKGKEYSPSPEKRVRSKSTQSTTSKVTTEAPTINTKKKPQAVAASGRSQSQRNTTKPQEVATRYSERQRTQSPKGKEYSPSPEKRVRNKSTQSTTSKVTTKAPTINTKKKPQAVAASGRSQSQRNTTKPQEVATRYSERQRTQSHKAATKKKDGHSKDLKAGDSVQEKGGKPPKELSVDDTAQKKGETPSIGKRKRDDEENVESPTVAAPIDVSTHTLKERLDQCSNCLNISQPNDELLFDGHDSGSDFFVTKDRIISFLQHCTDSMTAGKGEDSSILYICGRPGTGKTTMVQYCLDCVSRDVDISNSLLYSVVNGAGSCSQEGLLSEVAKHTSKAKKLDVTKLEKALSSSSGINKGKPIILVIDEINFLWKGLLTKKKKAQKNETPLETIFRWASDPKYRFGLIGISNSVGDDDAKSLHKLAKVNDEIIFQPYIEDDLVRIIRKRLGANCELLDDRAIKFVSRRVAQESGDCRLVLDLMSKAIIKCKESLKADQLGEVGVHEAFVKLPHVMRAIKDSGQMPLVDIIHALPQHAKTVLCVYTALGQVGNDWKVITVRKLKSYCAMATENQIMDGISSEQFISLLRQLEDAGTIKFETDDVANSYGYDDSGDQKIRLGVQLEDVECAIEKNLLEIPFYSRLVKHCKKELV